MSKEALNFVTPPPPKNDKICSAFSYNFKLALTDAILEKVEKGAGPILITDQGLPDLLLFGWEDYWQRFGSLYEPGDREKIEAEIKRKYEAEQVQPTGPIIDATPTK